MPHCRVQSPGEINVIAGCKNSIRHIENRFLPYFIFLVFLYYAVWAMTSGGFHIVSDTLVIIIIVTIKTKKY